ncbi:hypothetical protein FHS57_000055 [Runella defluvii]|uniref:Uncharacterized protein n=1 Tax=Runella defluvii TaxID=370973 RepID=A0A7W5ZEZ3_9BACT|nr:class I lanthipeptide [Runella defluvii]MBB3836073.1 hypothetical protein [Runella defluvii]
MKKQLSKLNLKTDKVVNLSKDNSQGVVGGRPQSNPNSKVYCVSDLCTFTGATFSC